MIEREKAFSRDVSHELRTPLATSRAAIELALAAPEGQQQHMAKFLNRAVRANADMSHLIETFCYLVSKSKMANSTANLIYMSWCSAP